MNRRTFLNTAAGGAVLASKATGLSAEAAPTGGRRRIPIGFLGASHSHGMAKVKVALASSDWDLKGVYEEDAATREACAKLGVPLLSRDEILNRSEVVAVESAVRDHARLALQALRAGRHVHVEKPPADNLADMRSMLDAARDGKHVFQTGYMWRHNPAFLRLFEAVRQGWLGDIFMVRAFISNSLPAARRPEWGEFKGGVMFELGAHLIDPIVRLLGRPKSVTPFLRDDSGRNDGFMDNNVAVLEFGRCLAVVMNSSLHPGKQPPRSMEVLGSNGTATIRPIEPPALQIELIKAAGPYQAGVQSVTLPSYQRYVDDFVELAAAVRGERAIGVTVDEELAVQETLLRASGM